MAKVRLWAPRRSRRLSKGIPLCCAPCRSPDNLPSDFLGARGVAIGHKATPEFCNVVRNCPACVAIHLRCRWRQSLRSVRPSRTRQGRCPALADAVSMGRSFNHQVRELEANREVLAIKRERWADEASGKGKR
jgi:hypothetical protein